MLVDSLLEFLDGNIWKWCVDVNFNELWQSHPRQFLEMKVQISVAHMHAVAIVT